MSSPSVADIEGGWVDPNWDSGLINRLRRSWNTLINELSNEMLATFLRQDMALEAILEEAKKRLVAGFDDDSEMYDGELANAIRDAESRRSKL